MSADSVIIIDAGGRTFKTSTTTLEASGAGYFEALLGETGRKLRGKKRARVDETPEEENVSEEDITVSESEEEETPKTKKKTKRGKRGTAHKQRTPGYFAKGRPNKKQKTVSSQ